MLNCNDENLEGLLQWIEWHFKQQKEFKLKIEKGHKVDPMASNIKGHDVFVYDGTTTVTLEFKK